MLFTNLTQREIIQILQDEAILSEQETISAIINDIITTKSIRDSELVNLEERYIQSVGSLPISEKLPLYYENGSQDSINNQLENAYDAYIITMQNSYFMGKGIDYSMQNESDANKLSILLKQLKNESKDKKTALYCSMLGSAGRIFWLNKSGKVDSKVIKPYEFSVIKNDLTNDDEVYYALIYKKFDRLNLINGESESVYRAEWYDKKMYYVYEQISEGSDKYTLVEEKPHSFNRVPLIEFKNDEYKKSDVEKVITLIDAYNSQTSYDQDEVERFRNAYLAVSGASFDSDSAKEIHKYKMISIPDPSGKAQFITKDINDTFHKNQREMLDSNIFKFSQTVDFSDEKFSGASQTGESRKWKMMVMEQKRTEKEMFFKEALDEQFLLLSTSNIYDYKYLENGVEYKFFENIPVDTDYWAGVVQKMKGNFPLKRIYQTIPFVENPETWANELNEEITGETVPETITENGNN